MVPKRKDLTTLDTAFRWDASEMRRVYHLQSSFSSEPRAVRLQLRDTRRFVEARLSTCSRFGPAKHGSSARRSRSTWRKSLSPWKGGSTSPLVLGTCPEVRLSEWCRGPESNWLRPPFQGGALPMSYPGFSTTYECAKTDVSVFVSLSTGTDAWQSCSISFAAFSKSRSFVML